MKKLLITTLLLGLLLTSGTAFAANTESKGIAVVDVQEVIMNSAKVKALETERFKQEKELKNFIIKARETVDAEKNDEKKKALQKKYSNEISQKAAKYDKELIAKTKTIKDEILNIIQKHAKENGYEIVITKNSVLYGGVDITKDIIKTVK